MCTRPDRGPLPAAIRGVAGRLALTYALCAVENLLAVALPWALGLAVGGLLAGSAAGLGWYTLAHLGHVLVGTARRAYDTRTFARLYGALAAGAALDPVGRTAGVSAVAARAGLCREVVGFLEGDVPFALQSGCAVAGSLAALAVGQGPLAAGCVALAVPVGLLGRWYADRCRGLCAGLHDELERQVGVIDRGHPEEVADHYRRLAGWTTRLSDAQAAYFACSQALVAGLVAGGLYLTCGGPAADAGRVVAALRYVTMFAAGLDGLPAVAQQWCRVRDLAGRLRAG